MSYEIERGIEIPKAGRTWPKYPLREMAVGDSVWVPLIEKERVRSAAGYVSRYHGSRFKTLQMDRDGEHGLRVWRIE